MSIGNRIPLTEAERVASEIVSALTPYCERVEVVGSIRRRRPDVGDIEVLAIPRHGETPVDLFGLPLDEPPDLLHQFMDGNDVRFSRRDPPAWGRGYKRAWWDNATPSVPLDLFACKAEQWGVLSVIRTGPAEFSRRVVTQRSKGGLLPSAYSVQGGRILRGGVALDTPREGEVFEILGVPYIAPEDRR